jgi:hypothetical protein
MSRINHPNKCRLAVNLSLAAGDRSHGRHRDRDAGHRRSLATVGMRRDHIDPATR